MNKEIDEEFEKFESKIDEVVNILESMQMDKTSSKNVESEKNTSMGSLCSKKLSQDEFIVKIKQNRTVINKKALSEDSEMSTKNDFMLNVEEDAAKRTRERKEREAIAQNLRKLGNEAFRKREYEKAINMFTKAIDHVRDSPVLYNNRALTYIRLGLYKKAIIDADFVLQKLDEKNVRSWLYRANGYLLLGEERSFEKSVSEAKKNNPKELDFIEKSVTKILETLEDK